MLELLLAARDKELAELRAERSSRPRGDRSLVARMETAIADDPARAITFDAAGLATVNAAGHCVGGGRFMPQSIRQLRAEAQKTTTGSSPPRLFVITGADPVTDIGMLQANAEPGTLFQVASQFNCLEAPGPGIVSVQDYFGDSTQGPRASISAFPGTLVRHYAAPSAGGRFVQTDDRQLNLLAGALPTALGRVHAGYLMTQELTNLDRVAKQFEEQFEAIQVGVHDAVPVLLGERWDGPVQPGQTVAQVFTSTLALGGYSEGARFSGAVERICRQLLRASYLGTLLAAMTLGQRRVVLTMIGGGVFGNPHGLIWECILWAFDEVRGTGQLDVILNGRQVEVALADLKAATAARGGVVVEAEGGRVRLQ